MMSFTKNWPTFQLYKKEIYTNRIEFLVIFAFNILWPLFLISVPRWIDHDANHDLTVLCIAIPGLVIFLWMLWMSFKGISYEWEHNTSFLLLSLPISGLQVLAVKIASILTMLFIYIIQIVGIGLLVNTFIVGDKINIGKLNIKLLLYLISDSLLGLIYLLIIAAIIIIICQFAFILSRLVNKFSKIFAVISAGVGIWVFFRGTAFLTFLINLFHLPNIKLLFADDPLYCNPAPLIATLLLSFGFLFATAKLFDHVIEV